jgi:tetraacyldisaccharide 4'-kinase
MSFFLPHLKSSFIELKAMRLLAGFLSGIYCLITKWRNLLYDYSLLSVYQSRIPVVCVGNLTAGGTGKTPLVLALVASLIEKGETPVILSRGYGGRLRGPHKVVVNDLSENVGDEPLLMARRSGCDVVIARDRVAGAHFIEDTRAATVIVLDDGFQHRRLGRACNIVSFFVGTERAVEEIVAGELLPKGRFREDRDRGLRRADFVALCERGGGFSDLMRSRVQACIPPDLPIFEIAAIASPPNRNGAVLEKGPVWLFCAIANPEGFFNSVKCQGYTIAGTNWFPDHHQWSVNELADLKERARLVPLVCTEKDWIKLPETLREDVWVVFLKVELPDALIVGILERCKFLLDRQRTYLFPK